MKKTKPPPTIKTSVQNRQTAHRINLEAVDRLTERLAAKLVEADPATRWDEVTVVLTGHEGITQANREFFGKNRPTDVISFRCEAVPGEDGATGDLLVNVDCAVETGAYHNGPDYELALYIAHGFNHLSGADDDTPQRRAAMRRTETRRLKELFSDKTQPNNLILD